MLNKKWLFLVGLTAALSLSGPAFAHTNENFQGIETDIPEGADEDESFGLLLRAYDILPNPEAMKERWPDVVDRLASAAENPENSRYERLRATSFLGNFDDPGARFALIRLTSDQEPRVRALAYYTLGAAFLKEGSDALLAHLEAGLLDEEERVRADVVRSLRFSDHPRALELLEEIAHGDDERLQRIAQRALNQR